MQNPIVSSVGHAARFSTYGRQPVANQDWYETPKINVFGFGIVEDKNSSSLGRVQQPKSKNE
jgi:hypothetical protein